MSSAFTSLLSSIKLQLLPPILGNLLSASATNTPGTYAIKAVNYGDYYYYTTNPGLLTRFRLSTGTVDTPITSMSGILQYPAGTRYGNLYIIIGGQPGGLTNPSSTAYSYNMSINGTTVSAITSYPTPLARAAGDYLNNYGYIFGGSISYSDTPTTGCYYWNGSSWTATVTLPDTAGGMSNTSNYAVSNPLTNDKIYIATTNGYVYTFDGTSYTAISNSSPTPSSGNNTLAIGNKFIYIMNNGSSQNIYYKNKLSGTSTSWTNLGNNGLTNGYPLVATSSDGSTIVVGLGGSTSNTQYRVITYA